MNINMIIYSNTAGSIIDHRVAQSLQEFTISKTVAINQLGIFYHLKQWYLTSFILDGRDKHDC
jgi:hypothetical protein